jgi:membrane protein DedA with SNARE-associated domain
MLEFLITPVIDSMPYFASIGILIYLVVFTISLLESSPVGAVFPGVIVMLYFGSVISQGYMHFFPCVMASIIGAVIGDIISYYLGRYGRRFFKDHHKYLSTKNLEAGRHFFDKYGAKSIVIARFIGPIRPAVPIVAGTTHMDFKLFNLWNVVGATVWSVAYLMLGVLVGKKWHLFGLYFSEVGLILSVIGVTAFLFWLKAERKKIVGI